jgi:hypothetical protein
LAIAAACAAARSDAAVIFDQTLAGKSPVSGENLSAHVVFDLNGSALKLTVTNTGDPARVPADVLTGVLWNVGTPQTFTPSSVDFTTQTDQMVNSPAANSLGKHWEYSQFAPPVVGTSYGVGASGLGGIFAHANFASGGAALQGVDYGIVNGVASNANKGVNVPLASNSLTFTLNIANVGGAPASTVDITGVRLQYGSIISDPSLAVGTAAIPEPAAIGALALSSGIALTRRRRQSK